MNMMVLLGIGVLIIVILCGVAGYYHVLLYKKNRESQRAAENAIVEAEARKKNNIESIIIISRAVLDDQVSLTEASIRINALSQTLDLTPQIHEVMESFHALSEATAHIPILDKWKALPKKEKLAFDIEREEIESKYREQVRASAIKIAKNHILIQ